MHGHGWRKCDFCAKIIKSTDFIASLEPAKKKELLEAFMKEQARCRQQKQKANTTGRARLLQVRDIDTLYEVLTELEHQQHALSDEEDAQP
jgi:hypothetical protein